MALRHLVVSTGKGGFLAPLPLTTMVSRQSKRGCSRWCPLVMILWNTCAGRQRGSRGAPVASRPSQGDVTPTPPRSRREPPHHNEQVGVGTGEDRDVHGHAH